MTVFGAWAGIAQVVAVDALAKYRLGSSWGDRDGIILSSTEFVAWDKERKAAQATAHSMVMAKDRSSLTLNRVTGGRLFPEKGDPLQFSTQTATYEMYRRRLASTSPTTLTSKDFSLQTASFTWDERGKSLVAPGKVTGRLGDGQLRAYNLRIDLAKNSLRAGPVAWAGTIQDAKAPGGRRRWEFRGDDIQVNGELRVYVNGRATDGEIILKAPRIEHNTRTDVVMASGGVKYWGQEANISAPRVVAYRRESRVVASGGVSMLLKAEKDKGLKEEEIPDIPALEPDKASDGKPITQAAAEEDQKRLDEEVRSSGNLRKFPTAIRAAEITYWYREGERRAVVKGAPQARQEMEGSRWRMVWGDNALYDGEGDWLTLKSRPSQKDARLRASTGDDFRAEEFRVSTKENDDRWSAVKGEGVTYVDEDEIPARSGSNPPPPPRRQ